MINPRISVIVPVFNLEDYIERNIQSLVHQDYDNYEVLYVDGDDYLADGSLKFISELMTKYNLDLIQYEMENCSAFEPGIIHESANAIGDVCRGKEWLIRGRVSWLKRKIKTFFIGSARYWLCTGQEAKKYLCHYGAESERIFIYPFSSVREADIEYVTPDNRMAARRRIGVSEQKMILFVGSFIPRKGVDILHRACRNMQEHAGYCSCSGRRRRS